MVAYSYSQTVAYVDTRLAQVAVQADAQAAEDVRLEARKVRERTRWHVPLVLAGVVLAAVLIKVTPAWLAVSIPGVPSVVVEIIDALRRL